MPFWYRQSWLKWLLSPLAALFGLISWIRCQLFNYGLCKSYRAPVPVVVVGNLSVGGNGKTPVVIWLVQQLQQQGLNVAVISRGYGSKAKSFPLLVKTDSDPVFAGDEPVLIAKRTGVPVCISPNRQQAIELLLKHHELDCIISDDGLQHYALQRDIEIVVIEAERGFGNGFLLPAGPLRELPSRLAQVDLVISNGKASIYSDNVMTLHAAQAINLKTGEQKPLMEFHSVIAIAGIGNPQRFFQTLQDFHITLIKTQAFQDHQAFDADLLAKFDKNQPLLMTEKDAVKCINFAQDNWWYVPVDAQISGQKVRSVLDKILRLSQQGESNE